MNDSTFQQEAAAQRRDADDAAHNSDLPHSDVVPRDDRVQRDDDVPQFGAVDIVEAFTAMRHEWRGQTKESRLLAELIQGAVTNIQSLESQWLARVAEVRAAGQEANDAAGARPLVLLIIETDQQLSRAVSAIAQWETNRRLRAQADAEAAERYFAGMNGVVRWLARPLLTFIAEQRAAQDATGDNPAIEGLSLVLARLRRVMNEQEIERIEALGQEFDADTMHAIGTVATAEFPSGHVAEQFSPAYRWQGTLLRFAEVRVAQ